ncbi:hypothetical protein BN946_scf184946.g5 [Trametes cinnabarina]|uniref:Uncharacterized protein n=1 Tax=Pycnoporus cinnabarinus TaxID=5643 RepID=A0A060SYH7_PYCCI|nr:hypothetical protein BN946_scf184946.g5 [Trametes cinnabarina]
MPRHGGPATSSPSTGSGLPSELEGYEEMPLLIDDDEDEPRGSDDKPQGHPGTTWIHSASQAPPTSSNVAMQLEEDILDILHNVEDLLEQQGAEDIEVPGEPTLLTIKADAQPGQPLEPEYGYSEDIDVPTSARRCEVRKSLQFVRELRDATLDESTMDEETLH